MAVTYSIQDPSLPESVACIDAYFDTLMERFDVPFQRSQTHEVDSGMMRLPNGALILAKIGDLAVGCGALKFVDPAFADIKHVWVSPDARGKGVGRGLMQALETLAAEQGYGQVRLDTNKNLIEAIAMYRKLGYREVPAFNDEFYAHHWFEKNLNE